MSYELVGIIVMGSILGLEVLVGILYAERNFREMQRMTKAVAGLVVQESERIQRLFAEAR